MSIRRVALVFDNSLRPETTGLYCRRALGCLVDVEHFLPSELGAIPRGRFDLFLRVDDGLEYELPAALGPWTFWAIDTHVDFDRTLSAARAARFVFAAQRNGAERLTAAGTPSAWLPLGCDPEIHRPYDAPKEFDVCFVGNLVGMERRELLGALQQRFARVFCGRRYFEQMAWTYSASRIVFNRSVADDLNMRVFEALACGAFLLTNDLDNGQPELFRDSVHLADYRDREELLDKAAFYLERDDLRQRIAQTGRGAVLAGHTYLHRMTKLLRSVEEQLARTSLSVPDQSGIPRSGAPAQPVPLPRVSACLVSWKRPENVRRIVEHLRAVPFIDDILVWNNNPDARLVLDVPGVRVIDSPANLVTLGRYECARHARHDVIYTQDDDCLVHNVEQLYEAYRLDPSRITHALKLGHLVHNAENVFDDAQMALVGWGAFFQKAWIDVLGEYRAVFGDDPLLCREADRLFSLLQDRRHRSVPAQVTDLEGAEGAEALSVDAEHFRFVGEAISRALALLKRRPRPAVHRHDERTAASASPAAGAADGPTAAKDPTYFQHARPEVMALVPQSARRLLDVGCGAGRLGEALKQRQAVHVTGLELEPLAAQAARSRLDEVLVGDIERQTPAFADAQFDCIVCADILEHLRRPERFLEHARSWLAPDGTLVASLPNVQHHSVIASLLAGNFTYESAGLLDQDHVRLFTRSEIEKLFYRAGFDVQSVEAVPGPGFSDWKANGAPSRVQVGRLTIDAPSSAEAEQFFAYQYLMSARPSPRRAYGLTSIVILTHNELDYTRQCLDSIRFLTDEPYELILVDNGSTDRTVDYLRSLADIRLIENAENRGFPAAANQGIQAARGDNILLLNNDVIVTTGWLRRLLEALHSRPEVGLAGPLSNNVSGEQQISVDYQSLAELDGFAWRLAARNRARWTETDRVVGFCLLVKREVIDRIGLLDEQFGIGCFEDDDFCRRALAAGYRAVIAQDVFLHHFGSRTFFGSGVDFAAIMAENQRKYARKWTAGNDRPKPGTAPPPTVGTPRPKYRLEAGRNGGLVLRENDIRLSLCMIVRNNEGTIEACLKSIRPWVDEMIVVDTGSTDRTPEICRTLGARVFKFAWCDDFSAARNESVRHARGAWIFWMDSDDTIDEANGQKLRALADRRHPDELLGYVMQVHCPAPASDGRREVTAVDHLKLFRNRPDLRFEFCIHEQIIPAIRRAGGEVGRTDLFVVHSGADHTPEGRRRKLERDFRLLAKDLDQRPDHPFVLFNLGMTLNDAGRHDEAIPVLRRSIEVSQPTESHVRKAYALLAGSLAETRQRHQALAVCHRALSLFPDDKELLFRSASLHHHLGRLDEAEQLYMRVLTEPEVWHFTSIDRGLVGYKARHNLARIYEDMGRFDHSELQWRAAVEDQPRYREGWRGLGESLLRQDKQDELAAVIGRLQTDEHLRPVGHVLAALRARSQNKAVEARQELEAAIAHAPDDLVAQHELCRLLFEAFAPEDAEPRLRRLAELTPDDPSVHHNLGTVLRRLMRRADAIHSYQKSLGLRPKSPRTWVEFSRALKDAGRLDEARNAWRRALELEPGSDEILQELESAVKTSQDAEPHVLCAGAG